MVQGEVEKRYTKRREMKKKLTLVLVHRNTCWNYTQKMKQGNNSNGGGIHVHMNEVIHRSVVK
jgi:hypothetical protein